MGVIDEGPQEAQPAVNGTGTVAATRACGHTAAPRYEVSVGDGTWWELGWDPPLATYYAQHWHDPADDDERVTEWLGTWFDEHPSVDSLEDALGWMVPDAMRVELDADRMACPSTHRRTA